MNASSEIEKKLPPLKTFAQEVSLRADSLKSMLPSHISLDKFQKVVVSAATNNPSILNADRMSLWNAALKAAQDGLLPDGRESAFVVFRTKSGDVVQYMPMVFGVRKKILQSGDISNISTALVYKQELESGRFEYEEGTNRRLSHRPMLDIEQDNDDIIAAYSVASFKDGTQSFEVMSRHQIDRVRASSKSANAGPWVSWFGEMARKTVLRRHAKSLPQSSDLVDVEARDDAKYADSLAAIMSVPALPAQSRLDEIESLILDTAAGNHEQDATDMAANTIRESGPSMPDDAAPSVIAPAQAASSQISGRAEAIIDALHDIGSDQDTIEAYLQSINLGTDGRGRRNWSGFDDRDKEAILAAANLS
jgi:phage RecT family recombinase